MKTENGSSAETFDRKCTMLYRTFISFCSNTKQAQWLRHSTMVEVYVSVITCIVIRPLMVRASPGLDVLIIEVIPSSRGGHQTLLAWCRVDKHRAVFGQQVN